MWREEKHEAKREREREKEKRSFRDVEDFAFRKISFSTRGKLKRHIWNSLVKIILVILEKTFYNSVIYSRTRRSIQDTIYVYIRRCITKGEQGTREMRGSEGGARGKGKPDDDAREPFHIMIAGVC